MVFEGAWGRVLSEPGEGFEGTWWKELGYLGCLWRVLGGSGKLCEILGGREVCLEYLGNVQGLLGEGFEGTVGLLGTGAPGRQLGS